MKTKQILNSQNDLLHMYAARYLQTSIKHTLVGRFTQRKNWSISYTAPLYATEFI